MSADSMEDHFTVTEFFTGEEPEWVKTYLELPEEEKQSSFVATIQLLPGSDKLEIEEMRVSSLGVTANCRSKIL